MKQFNNLPTLLSEKDIYKGGYFFREDSHLIKPAIKQIIATHPKTPISRPGMMAWACVDGRKSCVVTATSKSKAKDMTAAAKNCLADIFANRDLDFLGLSIISPIHYLNPAIRISESW